jgi:hypothetical protein
MGPARAAGAGTASDDCPLSRYAPGLARWMPLGDRKRSKPGAHLGEQHLRFDFAGQGDSIELKGVQSPLALFDHRKVRRALADSLGKGALGEAGLKSALHEHASQDLVLLAEDGVGTPTRPRHLVLRTSR